MDTKQDAILVHATAITGVYYVLDGRNYAAAPGDPVQVPAEEVAGLVARGAIRLDQINNGG